jgi:hypothetical protein
MDASQGESKMLIQGAKPMIVPDLVPFSSLTPGDVMNIDGTLYAMKCDDKTIVTLATGAISVGINPAKGVQFLPAAKLVLG